MGACPASACRRLTVDAIAALRHYLTASIALEEGSSALRRFPQDEATPTLRRVIARKAEITTFSATR